MTAARKRAPSAAQRRGVETSDIAASRVGFVLLALLCGLLLVSAAVAALLSSFAHHAVPRALGLDPGLTPPEPRLQVDERMQRREVEARASTNLAPSAGRIGIDEAMRRTAHDGWPK